jgi:transforming growth factor-beta-induced protein
MKNFIKFLSMSALALATMILISSCNKDEDEPQPENPIETKQSIVEIATSNENFSILVEALTKADLVTALQGDGPFTVFAPTNAAFEKLFTTLGVEGIKDIPAETLSPILLYHVVAASAKSSSLNTSYIETLNTTAPDQNSVSLFVNVDGSVMLNGMSKVSTADVEASNGIIHVIDEVLLPPTVVDFAISNANFSILVEAVAKAGLVDALNASGPFTIFAPTNAAFEALFAELQVSGIADLSAEALTPILLYHVVSGNVTSSQVATGMVPTLNADAMLDVMVSETGVKINDNTNVVAVDVQGTNGVIHVIDKVLLP